MNDLKPIIAINLVTLRKSKGLTQAELAERFNYSDKAISRWERGDTLPGIDVLAELCTFYGITLDDLVHEGGTVSPKEPEKDSLLASKIILCALILSIVWMIATCLFVYNNLFNQVILWQIFVYAVPVSFLSLLLLARRFGLQRYAMIFFSGFIWTLLASVYIYFLHYNIWLIFLIGIPCQITIFMWFRLRAMHR